MFRADNLVIYKNRPALVREIRDRIEIRTEDGASVKVRDKDLYLLHEGPVKTIPAASVDGDFETARKMLAGESDTPIRSSWSELAELVFGTTNPSDILGCFEKAVEGLSFVLEEGMPGRAAMPTLRGKPGGASGRPLKPRRGKTSSCGREPPGKAERSESSTRINVS